MSKNEVSNEVLSETNLAPPVPETTGPSPEDRMRAEYEAAAHLSTAVAIARTAAKLLAGRKMRAAQELGAQVVEEVCAYAECVDGLNPR